MLTALALTVAATPADAAVTPLPSEACSDVQYGGTGEPDAIIATDLPRQGASRRRSLQMEEAVRLRLINADWRAGDLRVGVQICDDASSKTGAWSPELCERNARAYSANPDVLGVIGTYNSGCAQVMLPILNRAPGGGVPMISPGNTLVCLTVSAATCAANEPRRYFPTGTRTYARVVPNDADQGAALATFARQRLGARRVAVLEAAGDVTSHGQAQAFRGAAQALRGISVVANGRWNPEGSSFRGLMRRIARARPDAVVLAGLTEQRGGRLIRDKVAVMGSNRGRTKLLAFDGFAQSSTLTAAGDAARGMYASVPGRAPSRLTSAAGRRLVNQLERSFPRGVELFAPYAGQAADVLLDAIQRGDGRRGQIAAELFQTRVRNGIVGDFRITSSGDPDPSVITVNIARRRNFRPARVVEPSRRAVRGALAGPTRERRTPKGPASEVPVSLTG